MPANRGYKSILLSCPPVQSHSTVTIPEDGENTHLLGRRKGDRYAKVDQISSHRGEGKSIQMPANRGDKSILHSFPPVQCTEPQYSDNTRGWREHSSVRKKEGGQICQGSLLTGEKTNPSYTIALLATG
eukprot:GFUD01042701.1.p1 GENE.GFUD01042701.1~~GFUD01042701.1.p1  ORF type:complete len:129 (+),score=29.01 GFUD01042701.1:778-1164(+)